MTEKHSDFSSQNTQKKNIFLSLKVWQDTTVSQARTLCTTMLTTSLPSGGGGGYLTLYLPYSRLVLYQLS